MKTTAFKAIFGGLYKSKHIYKPVTKRDLRLLVKDNSISLKSIDVSMVKDMGSLFYGANREDFDGIEDWDVSNVESMSRVFKGCEEFNKNLSKWNVSKVKDMSKMFHSCHKFEGKGLEDWDVSNVEDMHATFLATSLKENLSKWDVSKVKDMGKMFFGCDLKDDDFGSWDVSNVTSMEKMFFYCRTFEGKGLERWGISNVKNMSKMFYNSAYKDRSLLDIWDISHVENKEEIFGEEKPWVKLTFSEKENQDILDAIGLKSSYIKTQKEWDKYCLYVKEHGEKLESHYKLRSSQEFDMNVDVYDFAFDDVDGAIIKNGKAVSLVGTMEDADTSEVLLDFSEEPLVFTMGLGEVVFGLENEIRYLNKNKRKSFIVKAKDAYGEYQAEKIHTVPKEEFGDYECTKGETGFFKDEQGNEVEFTIKEVADNYILIDLNHLHAGKDLLFDVEVADVRGYH